MIKTILSVGGILFFVAMFLYFMANPFIVLNLAGMGIRAILNIIAQFFSYLAGLI